VTTGDSAEDQPATEVVDGLAHEHTIVRIRGVWEERTGLFEIKRRVCLECTQVLDEQLVALAERRAVTRPAPAT
jgi:hypothetical protein